MSNNGNNSNTASKGIGFFGLLQIVFIVLKLCGVIDWHWALVILPIIIEAVIIIAVLLFAVLLMKDN